MLYSFERHAREVQFVLVESIHYMMSFTMTYHTWSHPKMSIEKEDNLKVQGALWSAEKDSEVSEDWL